MAASREEVYERVQAHIPSISLATVYKNIHLFIASGLFREVSLHHGSLRVEMNDEAHHHMVCSKCKAITDIGEKELGLVSKKDKLPGGFLVERYAVDVIGIAQSASELRRNSKSCCEVMYGRTDEEQDNDDRRWPSGRR